MTESVSRSSYFQGGGQRRRGGAAALAAGGCALLAALPARATITEARGQDYVDECEIAGVPAPPPFNYEDAFHNRPTSEWRYSGALDRSVTFAGDDLQTAEVFYYESTDPEGVCVALPRSIFPPDQTPDEGPPIYIDLLGVICQGVASSKACFYDHGTQYDTELDPFVTMSFGDGPFETTFRGGADLVTDTGSAPGGVCTNCHRGENVFFIHPESALDVPRRTTSAWHDPIVPADWPENPGPGTLFPAADSGCALSACHFSRPSGRFPALSTEAGSYCGLLEKTLNVTMPLGAVAADLTIPPFSDSLDLIRAACSSAPPPEENPSQKAMSFDGPAQEFWSAEVGTLSDASGNQTEGDAAMSVNASGYVRLDSLPFSTWELPIVGTEVQLDVFVPPAGQPNPFWLGAVQLYVTIPSAGLVNSFVAQVELTPGGLGWRTVTFSLPAAVRAALSQTHSDMRWGIAINTPQGAPPVQLDNLRFAGTLSPPPPPPAFGAIRYDFERAGAWAGRDGDVTIAFLETLLAYTGSGSLRIELLGNSGGRVYTAPVNSPPAGATVRYRVYIPGGAPVTAVQPYVMDQNGVWSDSWNPNLPRDGWVTLSVTVPAGAALPLSELGVKFYLNGSYSGPVYLDAIEW